MNKYLIQALLQGNDAYTANAHVRSGVFYSNERPIAVYPVLGLQEAIIDCTYYGQTELHQRRAIESALESKGVKITHCYGIK